jgi:hypothetical protein
LERLPCSCPHLSAPVRRHRLVWDGGERPRKLRRRNLAKDARGQTVFFGIGLCDVRK